MPFGRTEVLVPPLEPQERDLAQGKGQGAWEAVIIRTKNENAFLFGGTKTSVRPNGYAQTQQI